MESSAESSITSCPELKNTSDINDDGSSQNRPLPLPLPLPEQEVEQPLRSEPSVDSGPNLSKFSIRDYVFASRSKDMKTNWPFPEKTLQHCLDHGVEELLPPFQSREEIRKQSGRAGTSFVERKPKRVHRNNN